jgi:hypothetical protein
VKLALIAAAAEINTCIVMPAGDIAPDLEKYSQHIIPCISHTDIDRRQAVLKKARMVAIEYDDALLNDLPRVQGAIKQIGNALTIIRIPAAKDVESTVSKLAHMGAEIMHVVGDYRGMEAGCAADSSPRLLKDVIRAVHLRLVDERIRDEVTLVFSGGIAMAEHVPKAMLCGADLTAIDLPLLIAIGARLYEDSKEPLVLPEGLGKIPVQVVKQRMVNLMVAWHSQLLEVMGAMGIREARRLRGETGRAIFFDEIDNDTFGKLFKKGEAANV